MEYIIGIGLLLAAIIVVGTLLSMMFRRVVQANMVHIVQSNKKTTSYGKDTPNGNTYYEIPAWVPYWGITSVSLPVSIFDLDLHNYEAYDKGRLPFVVDVKAFFRITNTDMAAQRVADYDELKNQLIAVVQGAVRTVLASNEIESILEGRSAFGQQFTHEVEEQLKSWGVNAVKNIELMDIRDSKDSYVIKNIMEKKKSQIEMESRTEVAKNKQIASIAEIEADREIKVQQQVATQAVNLRTIDTNREVSLSNEKANQLVQEQQKVSKEKEMEVTRVGQTREAEIAKDVALVKAEQESQRSIILAEGQKQTTVIIAGGELEATTNKAKGITLEGTARAEAEKQMQLAPVAAQIELANKIGGDAGYQTYLTTIRQIEANQAIGVEQAKALEKADIKVITNAGAPAEGITKVMDLFSAKGGNQLVGMLEALGQTEKGKELIDKVIK